MSRLLVLSEVDCRNSLKKNGIYPDEFYTDFMLFKNKASIFNDVDIIIIFSGSCHFSKRHVLETIRMLQARANNKEDGGIKSLTVFTDIFLPSVNRYFKYQGSFHDISEYNGWKLVRKDSPIISQINRGDKDIENLYLTEFDKGNVEELRLQYTSNVSNEEPLRGYIQKPDFSLISEI